MTITQMIQTSPAKANELFGKLADTGEGAVKTREKLFAELKEELELHARLEEQHLFPVLRKHKETKDLVADAVNDNKQTRALLAELERLPKDSEDFPKKLTELRKVFQQHVRDERKELLPVVKKALSEEEAQAVAEKIEAGRAKVEETRREEAEQRRAETRREREALEAVERRARDTAVALTRPVEKLVEGGERAARTSAQAMRAGAGYAEDTARVAPSLLNEAGEAWMEWMNRTGRVSADTMRELSGCTSPVHLLMLQGRIAGEATQAWLELGNRLSQIALRASQEMVRVGR